MLQYYNIPDEIIKKYKISTNSNLSNLPHVCINGFEHYPDIPGIIYNGILITWGNSDCVDLQNPDHIAFIKDLITTIEKTCCRITKNKITGMLSCLLCNKDKYPQTEMPFISFDDTRIFYDSNDIDISDKMTRKTIETLCYLKRRQEINISADTPNTDDWTL